MKNIYIIGQSSSLFIIWNFILSNWYKFLQFIFQKYWLINSFNTKIEITLKF